MANDTPDGPAELTPEGPAQARDRPANAGDPAGAGRSPWAPPVAEPAAAQDRGAEPGAGAATSPPVPERAVEPAPDTTGPAAHWANPDPWARYSRPAQAWGNPDQGYGVPQSHPYTTQPYGGGYPVGAPHWQGLATQHIAAAPERRRGGLGGIVAVALTTALVGGLVGGGVGYSLAERSGSGGSSGVLSQPLPEVDPAATPLGPVEAVAQRVLPSVVQLRVEGRGATGEGSGMVLSGDGLILTNNHVVESAADGGAVAAVFQDGRTAPARIVGRDPNSDLAVIRAQGISGLTPVELGNSSSVRVGQQVVAFGSPLGLGGTVTTGIISALDRAVTVGGDSQASEATVLNALQTDAAINPGNSGGPLVDMGGKVIGINSAIATTGAQGGSIGVGFSIPINQAKRIAEQLERTGKATRAVLGVALIDDPQVTGARIQSVVPGGAAQAAGIRPGDVVIRLGDKRVATGLELQAAVRSRAPGEAVQVQLSDRTVEVTLGEAG
ncbi:trypsin-like peptidase domain-containing protein [Pseudonocardia acidicola]|uniref:Trypsin-like serine protease n=1 Tax=Pseudonocardia acidicola TaxID=2724939 RepID=A0ABX1SA73_9PSEU|nr:trypsin-like peptidase domain-containing protein [Pseudonocardia acidicola]NMH98466.1 trypsin-like serine protease [Pseudonocardia acidicola]